MGPTVAIWLPRGQNAPTDADLLAVASLLDPSATTTIELNIRSTKPIGGSETDSEGRPFGFNRGDTGFDGDELKAVEQALGYIPQDAIHVFAYANGKVDHRMLAELAAYFAAKFHGLIDFGGNLGNVASRAGRLFSIPYTAGSIPATFHVSDLAFLKEWLNDPAFHMVK
jgi:hypothetical protein